MHVMSTCKNFFYRIADQRSFVMVRSVDCEWPLFSWKTVGKNEKQVSEHHWVFWRPCYQRLAMAASWLARHPQIHELRFGAYFVYVFLHGQDCSQLRWFDNENETWALIHGQVLWEPEMTPPPPCLFSWIDSFSGDKSLAFGYQVLSWSLWTFVIQRLSHSPLQKREANQLKLRVFAKNRSIYIRKIAKQ